jgi:hypothetical protein
MAVDSNTHFRNRLKRVIYQSARSGGYFVKKSDGSRYYKPVAMYHVANSSAPMVKLTRNHTVPASLRPARLRGRTPAAKAKGGPRKTRKNKGMARGPREGAMLRMMNAESRRLAARRAAPKRKKIPLRIFKRSNPFNVLRMK